MYIIKSGKVHLIPVDFNVFYNNAKEYKKKIRYSSEYTITEKFFEEMCAYISTCDKEDIVVIDMKNVASYPTRLFTKFVQYFFNTIFVNVETDKIQNMLTEDLESINWLEEKIGFHSEKKEWEVMAIVNNYCRNVRKEEIKRIIASIITCDERKLQYLDSSGLYSNCYVDIKKLFINVEYFYYILFCLAEKVHVQIEKRHIDAFVSSSKNGAIIANILGGLLDIKEVHLLGIGPRYSMELGDSLECIKKGKKYAYIFDFMCTGTELKIASALINSKKAFLKYAVGIAKYKRDIESTNIDIEVLIDTKEMNVDFKLVGCQDDINK